MIELRVLIDEIDYDSLVDLLVPLAAEKLEEKGGFLALLGHNKDGLTGMARHMLKTMSQEKRDEFVLQLLKDKKGLILRKANEKAAQTGVGVKVLDLDGRRIEKN